MQMAFCWGWKQRQLTISDWQVVVHVKPEFVGDDSFIPPSPSPRHTGLRVAGFQSCLPPCGWPSYSREQSPYLIAVQVSFFNTNQNSSTQRNKTKLLKMN
jgi:hypothetical protein